MQAISGACDAYDIASRLAEHLVMPVRFAEEVEAVYEAGGRMFLEVGPRNVLTGLVQQTRGERPYLALSVNTPSRHVLTQLQHALAHLNRVLCLALLHTRTQI